MARQKRSTRRHSRRKPSTAQRAAHQACRAIRALAARVPAGNRLDVEFIRQLAAQAEHRIGWVAERRAHAFAFGGVQ